MTQTDGVPASALTGTGLSRKARRLHFGNLPGGTATMPNADQMLAKEIWDAMRQRGLECSKPGQSPVLSVWLSGEQNFAFVEFLSAEDATNGLMLDGMDFMGQGIRVSRPSDYIPDQSAAAGQQMAVQQLLANPQAMAEAMAGAGAAAAPTAPAVVPTAVLVFSNLTAPETSDSDLSDVLEDVTEEAQNSGKTVSTDIVRAGSLAAYQAVRADSKVGDVFLKFEEVEDAHKCYLALNGRMFAGNQVQGMFMDPATFDTLKL
eukprot:COSAG02_NODE_664_length_18739_cov_11.071567_25_plen_261_part_00